MSCDPWPPLQGYSEVYRTFENLMHGARKDRLSSLPPRSEMRDCNLPVRASAMSFLSARSKVLAAGVFNLILCMGIARFAYTPLLPQMQEQAGLGLGEAGWLASINYVGYVSGALIASLVSEPALRDRLYRAGMVVAVLTTAMMGATTDPVLWSVSRYFAGLSTAAGTLQIGRA